MIETLNASPQQLKDAIKDCLTSIDLNVKKRDFEHLLFDMHLADRILHFGDFVELNLA